MTLQDTKSSSDGSPDDVVAPAEFEAELVSHMRLLRVFALSLAGQRELAEDAAQETLIKAWKARRSFTPGSNFKAWLYVILRNELYSRKRRAWRQVPWEDAFAATLSGASGEQQWAVELSDTARAMRDLSNQQREALILVAVGGFSHDDAAALSKVPVGTVKSRVGRARKALNKILDGKKPLSAKSRPATGDAMTEIFGQLRRLSAARGQDACSPA